MACHHVSLSGLPGVSSAGSGGAGACDETLRKGLWALLAPLPLRRVVRERIGGQAHDQIGQRGGMLRVATIRRLPDWRTAPSARHMASAPGALVTPCCVSQCSGEWA